MNELGEYQPARTDEERVEAVTNKLLQLRLEWLPAIHRVSVAPGAYYVFASPSGKFIIVNRGGTIVGVLNDITGTERAVFDDETIPPGTFVECPF